MELGRLKTLNCPKREKKLSPNEQYWRDAGWMRGLQPRLNERRREDSL